jgi:hypothetical protein
MQPPDPIEQIIPSTKSNIDIEKLLDHIEGLISKHTILPKSEISAVTLWCAATYVINDFRIFSKLLITSPEKRCGKSTLLDLIHAVCHKSLISSNMTSATIYRLIDKWQPTLIIDEADTFVANSASDMTGIINSGHGRNRANVSRCVGDNFVVRQYSTWTPMVLASIGDLQPTIMDRSIVIQIRRKKTSEHVAVIPVVLFDLCKQLRAELLKWAIDNSTLIKSSPYLPPDIGNDRAADNWTPLFTIANLAGNKWFGKCSQAYQMLSTQEELGVSTLLLTDIQPILDDKPKLSSADLVAELCKDEDKAWCEYKNGRAITQNALAMILKPYGIKPKAMRVGGASLRGYELSQFTDTFDRYL